MAYNIVKHRRGTTREWNEINLIPANGELVIEECLNGTRKCKIGNGRTCFTELPYIDAELQKKLLQSVDELRATIDIKVNETSEELTTKILDAKQDLTNTIIDTSASLTDDYKKRDANVVDTVQTYVNNTVKNVKSELITRVAAAEQNSQEAVKQLDKKVSSEIKVITDTHEADLQSLSSEVNTEISTINKDLSKVNTSLRTLATEDLLILNKLNSTKNNLSETITNTDNRLSSKISELEDTLNDKIDAVEEELISSVTSVNSTITDDLNDFKQSATENIESLRSVTNIKIANTQKEINSLKSNLNNLDIDTSLEFGKLKASINHNAKETASALEEINDRLDDTDTRIDSVDAKVKKQSERISKIIAVQHGSTSGDIELMEIRKGYNGVDYNSAAEAVQAIGYELDELRNNLPNYIPANAVDGLEYNSDTNELYLTSKDTPVGDPVIIVSGGGGGGGISTVRVQNNLSSTSFAVAKGNEAEINFTYTSFENEVATGEGTYYITINSKRIDNLSGVVQHGVAKSLNVAEYLKNGSNSVKVTCTDQYGSSRSLTYSISVIELRIESSFDSDRIFTDSITFRYKVFGQIEKKAHILVDGIDINENGKVFSASVSGVETTQTINKQTHGSHSIKAYLSAIIGDKEVLSNIIEYEVICIEDSNKEAILASVYNKTKIVQGDLITISYMVYDPTKLECQVELNVYSKTGTGELTKLDDYCSAAVVGRKQQVWNTRKYPSEGKVVFEIKYVYDLYGVTKIITKTYEVEISKLAIDIAPVEDNLQLYLAAEGHSNTDPVPGKWTFNDITTTFENFNWTTNGWFDDGTGDTCLRLNGDAKAVINFAPFKTDFKARGKTLEFEFLVRDVNSRNAVVIDCFDGSHGFRATPDTAFLQSSGTSVSCRYKDGERVRVSIVVEYSASVSRFVSIYLDGILSGVQRYSEEDIFVQTNPVKITLGSNLCALDVYSIRVYDQALSTPQILTNYIADKTDTSIKQQLMADNTGILDENGKISYERVKERGNIPIITFIGTMPSYKGDKKKKSVYMKFEDPSNPDLAMCKASEANNGKGILLDQIDVQGTSSQYYVRKNWKIKLPEAMEHMPGAIPAKVFCIKVDYAEATGTHNTGTANYVETFYDRNEVTLPSQNDDPRVRTTIQGFPCILFEKETEDSEPVFSSKANFNYDKDAENAFGFTSDYDSFGVECWEFCNNTSQACNFTGEIVPDWSADFEPRYAPESANFERIEELLEAKQNAVENGGIFTEAQKNELEGLQATCIANFKAMHDWVLSTATFELIYDEEGKKVIGTKPIEEKDLSSPVTINNVVYTKDTEEYRLAKFANEFDNYFNRHYCSIYYVFTFFALMTDQRAKNMFLTRWKDADGVHRWYPYFYDNDTIFGINNEGALVFDYYHEDTDKLGSSNVYNGQNSVLWNNFRRCFIADIKSTYSYLRSSGKLTYDKIVEYYITNGSDKWSAAIYNEDADYKYISMAREIQTEGEFAGKVDDSNLYQVRGPGEHHLRYFASNRLNYCDSKWYAGEYPDDYIFLRVYTPSTVIPRDTTLSDEELIDTYGEKEFRIYKSLLAVPADPSITITPYSNIYAGVKYKANGTLLQARATRGVPCKFEPSESESFNDTETAIYGASGISSLGDLSGLYCGVISLGKATKLTELILGNSSPNYHNDNFREVRVGSNRLLKTIDLRNCSGLGLATGSSADSDMVDSSQATQMAAQTTLDLTGCPNIENIYTEGTNLQAVSLPESGYIKVLHLPSTINTLKIKNQLQLKPKTGDTPETDGFSIDSYANIRTLHIENCPQLDTNEILENCRVPGSDMVYSVEQVHLTGIDWQLADASFIKSLFATYDEDGNFVGGIRSLDADGNFTEAVLSGKCYIENITGEDYANIDAHYGPALKILFGTMSSNVTFNYDEYNESSESVESKTFTIQVTSYNSETSDCDDPILTNQIPVPFKASTDEFDYTFIGWSRQKDVVVENADEGVQVDALKNIAGDRVLYPVFKAKRKTFNVQFINPGIVDAVHVVEVPYGEDAVGVDGLDFAGNIIPVPIKQNVLNPNLYEFTGWTNTSCIIKDTICYAQFTINYKELGDGDNEYDWYVLSTTDLKDRESSTGTVKGYTIDSASGKLSISNCSNDLNPAVLIPTKMSVEGQDYSVTTIGGFNNHTGLEILSLPDSTETLSSRAFEDCYNLAAISTNAEDLTVQYDPIISILPASLKTINANTFHNCKKLTNVLIPAAVSNIGYAAFAECTNLSRIEVSPENTKFKVIDGCLVGIENKALIQGLPGSDTKIPENGEVTSLLSYCFAGVNITNVKIPKVISTVPQFAFTNCTNLVELDLGAVTFLSSSCFSGCSKLESVILPENLTTLQSSVFQGCAIKNLVLPATIASIGSTAFSNLTKLTEVIFADGTDLTKLKIEKDAFKNSGQNVKFILPWTEKQHYEKWPLNTYPVGWGANAPTLHFKEE